MHTWLEPLQLIGSVLSQQGNNYSLYIDPYMFSQIPHILSKKAVIHWPALNLMLCG